MTQAGQKNLIRGELIKKYGSQWRAAQDLGLRESRLSLILNCRVQPNKVERGALRKALGADYFQKQPSSAA